jgi:hypothetical protein
MSGPTEEEIRTRAYSLWEAAGRPNCKMDDFWYEAERQLLKENAELGEVPPGMTENLPV